MKKLLQFCCLLCLVFLCSCSLINNDKDSNSIKSTSACELLYEETISPNKGYVMSDEDLVKYTIQIFQSKENDLVIKASSNSTFFKGAQHVIDYDNPISKDEVAIKWTTLMGNPDANEKDQLAVANVLISSNSQVLIERKINFVKGEIEIITDNINQNKNSD